MAARLENLAMMRTVVAAAATVDDLDMDMVADLKLATDEACTRLVRSSVPNAMLVVRLDFHLDRLAMAVYSHCLPGDVFPLDSFSWHVLSSLADHVETFERAHPDDPVGHIVGVSLTKLRDSRLRCPRGERIAEPATRLLCQLLPPATPLLCQLLPYVGYRVVQWVGGHITAQREQLCDGIPRYDRPVDPLYLAVASHPIQGHQSISSEKPQALQIEHQGPVSVQIAGRILGQVISVYCIDLAGGSHQHRRRAVPVCREPCGVVC